jgi:hypothetical protein
MNKTLKNFIKEKNETLYIKKNKYNSTLLYILKYK